MGERERSDGLADARHEWPTRPVMNRRAVVASGLAGVAGMTAVGVSRMSSAQRRYGIEGTPVAASPAATPAGKPLEIEIVAVNGLRFSPSTIAIPAHTPVRIVFINRTATHHDLVIPTLARRAPRIGPEETYAFLIGAAPGFHRFSCSIPSHTQAGMEGIITAR